MAREQLERTVLEILKKNGPMGLQAILAELAPEQQRCPDETARLLARLRKRGEIEGEFSEERSSWIYRVKS